MRKLPYVVLLASLLALGGGLVFSFSSQPVELSKTVEIDLAEVSPKGEAGGYAIPASGSSYGCTMYGMPTSMTQGQTFSLLFSPNTTMSIYRNGTLVGNSGSPWTDGSSASLAPGVYTYELSGTYPAGTHCTNWEQSCSGDTKSGYSCSNVCTATDTFYDTYSCSSALTVKVPKPPPPSPTYVCSADATSVTFNYATAGAAEYFLRFDTNTSAPHINVLDDYTPSSWTKTGITPGQTYYFWVHAGNGGGNWSTDISDAGFTNVSPFSCTRNPPTVSCSASPNPAGVNASVSWSASASGGSGGYSYQWAGSDSLSGSGSSVNKSYNSAGTKTAQVKVTDAGGLTSGWVNCANLSVSDSPTPPTVNLTAANTAPAYDTATLLTWTLSGGTATSCTASNGWSGSKSTSGGTESTGNLTVSKTYTITCTGPGGSASDTVTVTPGGEPTSPYDLLSSGLGIQGDAVTITSGTPVTFMATAQNNSMVAVGAFNDTFAFSYGGSGGAFTPINTIAVSGLAANTSRTDTSSSISFATPGDVTVRHCTDSGAAITETNETNNCSERLYTVSSPNDVIASCAASPNPALVNASVTWSTSASGGTAPYSYQWTGSDSLSGSGSSVNKSYNSAGTKTAQVRVTDTFGMSSGWRDCTALNVVNEPPPPPPPTADLKGRIGVSGAWSDGPIEIDLGQELHVMWDSERADTCFSPAYFSTGGATSGQTSTVTEPAAGTSLNYRVVCTGPDGGDQDWLVVNSNAALPTLDVYPDRVRQGETTHVGGALNGNTACTIEGKGIDPGNLDGDDDADSLTTSEENYDYLAGPIVGETTYRIECSGGSASDTVRILPMVEHF